MGFPKQNSGPNGSRSDADTRICHGISLNPLGDQTWHWNMENHTFMNDLLAVVFPLLGGIAGG